MIIMATELIVYGLLFIWRNHENLQILLIIFWAAMSRYTMGLCTFILINVIKHKESQNKTSKT